MQKLSKEDLVSDFEKDKESEIKQLLYKSQEGGYICIMAKPDFTLGFIKEQSRLIKLSEVLIQTPVFAIDIETIDWWNRLQERIALIQIAFSYNGQIKVAVSPSRPLNNSFTQII